jgi:hypothetical protein
MRALGILVAISVAVGTLTIINVSTVTQDTQDEIKGQLRKPMPEKKLDLPDKAGQGISKEEIEEFLKGRKLVDTCTEKHEKAEESRKKIQQVICEVIAKYSGPEKGNSDAMHLEITKRLMEVCKDDIQHLPPLEKRLLEERLGQFGK